MLSLQHPIPCPECAAPVFVRSSGVIVSHYNPAGDRCSANEQLYDYEKTEQLRMAWQPFERLFQIQHSSARDSSEKNELPFSRFVPGLWPTWGDFKCLRDVLTQHIKKR